jgi:hypothetical protein
MVGTRIKFTWSHNAMGGCAAFFVTCTGCSERELPNDVVIIVKIEGLCIGGGTGSCKDIGYLCFTRGKTAGTELLHFNYYHENVLVPFIQASQKAISGINYSSAGADIPDELTAAAWCDGDFSQTKAIIEEHASFTNSKIIANKQNPQRTGVEQGLDLNTGMKDLNHKLANRTVANIDPSLLPFKSTIINALKEAESQGLSLKANKKKALIDMLTVLPEAASVQ